MIQDKIFFDEKDPTGLSYNTPFTYYGSYQGRLWSKSPSGSIQYYTQNSDLSAYATTGSNQFSGSQTVTGSLTVTGTITGTVAGTTSTASYVEYTNVANKPALISGSAQVTYSGLSGIPSGIVSGSAQIASFGIFATTGSNGFNGSQSITGSLTVTGQVVAQTLNVQQVTSSIVYSSGSNIFGNSLSNTQQFTGSVGVTGSLTVAGAGTFSSTVTATRISVNSTSTSFTPLFLNANGDYSTSGNMTTGFAISNSTTGRALNMGSFDSGAYAWIQAAYINNADTTFALALQPRGGNVGIGTNNPAEKLDVVGGGLAAGNGTIKTGITYSSLGLMGTFTNHDLGLLTNGSTKMTITSGGNVGIGETNPSTGKLQIKTSGTGGTFSHSVYLMDNSTYKTSLLISHKDGESRIMSSWEGGTGINSDLTFWTTTSAGSQGERMRITSAGLVSIGNSSPSANGSSAVLDIGNGNGGTLNLRDTNTGIAAEGFHQIYGGDNRMYLYAGGSGASAYMQFYTNDSERMRITSGGNAIFGYNQTTTTTIGRTFASTHSSANRGATLFYGINDGGSGGMFVYNIAATTFPSLNAQYITFETHEGGVSAAERMRINTRGEVLVGTTTPTYSAANRGNITVEGTVSSLIGLRVNGANRGYLFHDTGEFQVVSDSSSELSLYSNSKVNAGVDNAYSMGASGRRWSAIWAANGTIQTSDARQKKDILPTNLGLDFILQLNPVSYKWKVGGNMIETSEAENENEVVKRTVIPTEGRRTHYGLIAQEVKEVLGDIDFGGYIHDQDTDTMALRYDQFIAPLIKSIQELSAKVETLEAEIQTLKQ